MVTLSGFQGVLHIPYIHLYFRYYAYTLKLYTKLNNLLISFVDNSYKG